jgi:hypothetical protein
MTDSWDEYRRLVLSEIERIDRNIEQESKARTLAVSSLESKISEARESIVALQVKAGLWGAVAGGVAAAAGLLAK